jgi:hypothetical protein
MNASQKLLKLIEGLGPMSAAATASPFPVGNGFEWRPKTPDDREFCNQSLVCGQVEGVDLLFGLYGPNDKVHGIAAVDARGVLVQLFGRANMPFSPKYYGYFTKWAANDPRIRKIDPHGYQGGGLEAAQAAYNAASETDRSSFNRLTSKMVRSSERAEYPRAFGDDDDFGDDI